MTALVIAAWKFGGPESPSVPGLAAQGAGAAAQTSKAKGKARLVVARDGRQLVDGGSRGLACGQAPLQRHARAGSAEVVRGDGRSSSRSRSRDNVVVRVNGNRVDLPAGTTFVVTAQRITRATVLSRPRAAIVVTGSELVRGDRQDRNGPFLAAEAVRLGLDPARITIVGDRRRGSRARLRGGLRGRSLPRLGRARADARRSHGRARRARRRSGARRSTRSSSARSERSRARSPSGSAGRTRSSRPACASRRRFPRARSRSASPEPRPGSSSTRAAASSSCSQARRASSSGSGRGLSRRSRCGVCLQRAPAREHRVLRFFGTPESAVAEALAAAGGEGDGVEVTICAREFEIHVDLVRRARRRGARGARSPTRCASALATYLFGEDERTISEIVLDLCRARGLTLATAESCTGGMVAARLTSVPGASDVFVGSVVAYANDVKESEPRRVRPSSSTSTAPSRPRSRRRWPHGVACASRRRRRRRRHGRRRAGRRHAEKPVGLVFAHAVGPDGEKARSHRAPRRPRDDPRPRDGRLASSRASIVGESTHSRREPRRLPSRAMTGSGSSSRSSFPTTSSAELVRWGKRHLVGGRPVDELPRHARVPREPAARPRSSRSSSILRREAAATEPFELEPVRYRETRSVGMLVLADPSGRATALADRAAATARAPRRLRARGAAVAAARHRAALPRASEARSAAAGDRRVRSVRRRCFAFTPAPVRGAVRGTGVVFAR